MDAFASLSGDELISLVAQQAELNRFPQQEILSLRQESQRLKNGGSPPPWVKPNVAPASAEKPPRKPRSQAFVRHRQTPTQEGVPACSHCPACGRVLSGGTE